MFSLNMVNYPMSHVHAPWVFELIGTGLGSRLRGLGTKGLGPGLDNLVKLACDSPCHSFGLQNSIPHRYRVDVKTYQNGRLSKYPVSNLHKLCFGHTSKLLSLSEWSFSLCLKRGNVFVLKIFHQFDFLKHVTAWQGSWMYFPLYLFWFFLQTRVSSCAAASSFYFYCLENLTLLNTTKRQRKLRFLIFVQLQ